MKVYVIRTPEKLNETIGMIKWERDAKRVKELVKAWKDGSHVPERVTLEVGRNAHIFVKDADNYRLLATMYVAAARQFCQTLAEPSPAKPGMPTSAIEDCPTRRRCEFVKEWNET